MKEKIQVVAIILISIIAFYELPILVTNLKELYTEGIIENPVNMVKERGECMEKGEICNQCGGLGRCKKVLKSLDNEMTMVITCKKCKGTGKKAD